MTRRRRSDEEAAAEAEVEHLLKTEGIKAAAAAMIAVCNDPNATAQAKSTASRTIFEVTGSIKKDRNSPKDEAAERAFEDMPAEEYAQLLNEALQQASAKLARLEAQTIEPVEAAPAAPTPAAEGMFG